MGGRVAGVTVERRGERWSARGEVERIAPGGQPWELVHQGLQRFEVEHDAKGLTHRVHDLLKRWIVI